MVRLERLENVMKKEDKIRKFKWEIKEEGYVVCGLKRREIDKLGRESVIGIMVLSVVGPQR